MQTTLTAHQAALLIKKVEEVSPRYFASEDDIIDMFEALNNPHAEGHQWFMEILAQIQAA